MKTKNPEKIALSMIVKGTVDEAENLKRVLASAHPFVDGIFITITGEKKEIQECEMVARQFGANISYGDFQWTATEEVVTWLREFLGYDPHMKVGDKVFLFDEARNFNLSQIDKDKYPWFMWMDCDDVLLKGEKLSHVLEILIKENIEAAYFNYLYQVETDGEGKIKHVLIQHLRERLLRNNGAFKWIAPIHETLIEQRPTRKTDNYDVGIVHLATQEDRMKSLTRNLRNLELAIYQSKGNDPRHNYYLAKAFFDINTEEYDDRAIPLILNHYIHGEHKSGWPQERAQAWQYLGEIFRRKQQHDNTIKACLNALLEDPENPSVFLSIASTYMLKSEWERALFWVRLSSAIPKKKTTLVDNPKDIQARTLEIIYNCCINLSQVDEAWAAATKLLDLFPDDPQVGGIYTFIQNLRTQRDLTQQFVGIADFLKKTGERAKIKPLLAAAPSLIENNPFMLDLYKKNNPPKAWGEDEIAIFCGAGFTPWGPTKLTNPEDTFVGGSEEAVIHAAKALTQKGWKVTVYNDCGDDEGVHEGVMYESYYKFNPDDNFNILIGWRAIGFFDREYNAKKTYLWMHDIANPLEFVKERLDRITKIIFLSRWHRDNVPDVPDEKILISTNGI